MNSNRPLWRDLASRAVDVVADPDSRDLARHLGHAVKDMAGVVAIGGSRAEVLACGFLRDWARLVADADPDTRALRAPLLAHAASEVLRLCAEQQDREATAWLRRMAE